MRRGMDKPGCAGTSRRDELSDNGQFKTLLESKIYQTTEVSFLDLLHLTSGNDGALVLR